MSHAGRNEHIGDFPSKGIMFHYQFAKLYLCSHVFRGLGTSTLPDYFREAASTAVASGMAILELLLTDIDIQDGLNGMPAYLLTMIAFACAFLLQMAAKYDGDLVDKAVVYDLIARLVRRFRASVSTSRWHVVRLMANGLEKMAQASVETPSRLPAELLDGGHAVNAPSMQRPDAMGYFADPTLGMIQDDSLVGADLGLTSSFLPFEEGNAIFNSAGFDFL